MSGLNSVFLTAGALLESASGTAAESAAALENLLTETKPAAEEIAKDIEALKPDILAETFKKALPGLTALCYNLLIAALIVLIGVKLIGIVKKWSQKTFLRMKVDESVGKFLSSCISVGLYGILIFIVAGKLGLNSASIIALLGSAGIAISLALQGSLSNFAGGVLILLSKPFTVGDYIINADGEGTVSSIGIIYTTLVTVDNRKIVLPNGALANSPLTNVTAQEKRRVVISVGIGYSSDLRRAKDILRELFEKNEKILTDEGIDVYVDSLGESSVVLTVRGYAKTDDYWPAKWELTEALKLRFDEEGIEIPFNQLDVHMKQSEKPEKDNKLCI